MIFTTLIGERFFILSIRRKEPSFFKLTARVVNLHPEDGALHLEFSILHYTQTIINHTI